MKPNCCDSCSRERSTLYDKDGQLICLFCLPVSWLYGSSALRAIRAAVTGLVNIERRRRRLASQSAS